VLLRDGLISREDMELFVSPAVFLTKNSFNDSGMDDVTFKWSSRYLRELTLGEVGCAIAHNNARLMASKFSSGALILEDDAIILNLPILIEESMDFLKDHVGVKAVLTFYTDDNPQFPFYARHKRFFKRYQPPPYAVAYALTAEAAKELASSNSPVRCVADWPSARVQFFQSTSKLVSHGVYPSLIDPDNSQYRSKGSTLQGLSVATSTYFFLHRSQYSNFLEFYRYTWQPRAIFHIDALFRRLVGIR
jgi:GR25 family glycosyltransferase involved in LPS biosynthesis